MGRIRPRTLPHASPHRFEHKSPWEMPLVCDPSIGILKQKGKQHQYIRYTFLPSREGHMLTQTNQLLLSYVTKSWDDCGHCTNLLTSHLALLGKDTTHLSPFSTSFSKYNVSSTASSTTSSRSLQSMKAGTDFSKVGKWHPPK